MALQSRPRRASTSAIADVRLTQPIGNVGPQALTQMCKILADLIDL
jgi:hypothetical protein